MKEQHIPVGIFHGEIFIVTIEDGKLHVGIDGKPCFDVLRPVSEDALEKYRDMSYREDEYLDAWKEAVAHGRTLEGFDDWFEDLWEEEFDESDPEDFPGKDDSFTDYLTEDFRLVADGIIKARMGIDVGTWEASGCYPPDTNAIHGNIFRDWDYVFEAPLSKKYAKEFAKKYGRK